MIKIIDNSWDFIGSNTKEYTHSFHKYPAMMIPQIASRLISENNPNAKLLFDPYCGTGTSLVEAKLRNINAIGTDLNPLAILISKVKTTLIDKYLLENEIIKIKKSLKDIKNVIIPQIINVNYWFKENVINDLGKIKYYINEISNDDIKDFFNVIFSETIREVSLVRNGEFKMYRIEKSKIDNYNPDVYLIFFKKLDRNFLGMCDFINGAKLSKIEIYDFNTSQNIDKIRDRKIDIVITSPPYGDSKTTVSYGQFSRLSNEWLDIKNANQIDNILMGGKKEKNLYKTNIEIIDNIVNEINNIDNERSKDILSFLLDYKKSIDNISKLISKDGTVCYVVGNRIVKGISIPMDDITSILFNANGISHQKTIIRNIPNKRMPSKNSPSNKIGEKGNTITNEYIVIMKKN